MRTISRLYPSVACERSEQKLFNELAELRIALSQAYTRFDNTTEPELVDACIYEINALHCRYSYALRCIKRSGSAAAVRLYREGVRKWV